MPATKSVVTPYNQAARIDDTATLDNEPWLLVNKSPTTVASTAVPMFMAIR